jgi:magnesium chelatase subunit D
VLIGSMNPEEGELRPQLLDRFGFCVEMTSTNDHASRKEALRRRLIFDGHVLEASASETLERGDAFAHVLEQLRDVRLATTPDALLDSTVRLALEVGAEGLRADLTLCRAAAALAGIESRERADFNDLRRVAPLVLAHRSRRGPFDPPVMENETLERALERALNSFDDQSSEPRDSSDLDNESDDAPEPSYPGANERPLSLARPRSTPKMAPIHQASERGRVVRDVPMGEGRLVSVPATARALAVRRSEDPTAPLGRDDLRSEERSAVRRRTIVLCVDLSGSMGANQRAHAATGIVLGLLTDAYQRRDRVALVAFRGSEAQVLLTPTSSVEVARIRLEGLVTGGETPLASGITRGLEIARASRDDGSEPLLVLFTDGRATGQPGAREAAMAAAGEVRRRGVAAMVLDCEVGPVRLNLAVDLALAMGARVVDAHELDPSGLSEEIRHFAPFK